MNYTERQGHGFTFEEYVEKNYGVNRKGHTYTDKWDADINSFPCSIKNIKINGAVDCADLFRQASIHEDFIMIVHFYKNKNEINLDDLHFLYIPGEAWHSYFLDLDKFEVQFKNALNSVSNSHADDDLWTKLRLECVDFWKKNTKGKITVNGKRDHSTQKRWQCSINKTNFFQEFLPKYEISKEEYFKCLEKLKAMDKKTNLTDSIHLTVQYLHA